MNVLDLGCGTGSNLRGLSCHLKAAHQTWHLVDYDERLLQQIRAPQPDIEIVPHHRDLSDGNIADLIGDCDLVTASALFDLVSPAIIEKIAAQIAERKRPFYTVLTYDGMASWTPAHPLDDAVLQAFNAHQKSDKGFGPAAGPDATNILAEAFTAAGYHVEHAPSPWHLGPELEHLRTAVTEGYAEAIRETGTIAESDIGQWLEHHRANTASATIGHSDLLALPQ